jgi:hypothetical protein
MPTVVIASAARAAIRSRTVLPPGTGVRAAWLLAAAVLGASLRPLHAQAPAPVPSAGAAVPAAGRRPLDLSIGVRGGTLGYGAEVGKLVASHLGVRVAAYVFSYARQQGLEDVQYDASVKFGTPPRSSTSSRAGAASST